jgi:hypothetical protein
MKRFSFKNRPVGFYIQAGTLLLGFVSTIVFFSLNPVIMNNISFSDYSWVVFLFNMSAVAVGFVSLFFFDKLQPISPILFGCGFGQLLSMSCFPWTDIAKDVFFFSGSEEKAHLIANFVLPFLIVFGIVLVCSIASCFLKTKEEE